MDDQASEDRLTVIESVINAAKTRLEAYQDSKYNCRFNAEAIDHLEQALEVLAERRQSRVCGHK